MSDQHLPPPRANSIPQRMHSLSPVNSISQSPTIRMPSDNRAYFDGQQQRNGNGNGNVNGMIVDNGRKRARTQSTGDHAHERVSPTPGRDVKVEGLPSVLVREKKQKACANCRRAKLKCIVEGNETDCVRCRARKERCIFYPRGHDEDWQQTLTADLYTAINHLAELSAAMHHMMHHLTAQGAIPPYERPLPGYEAPERDLTILKGWTGDKNRELSGNGNRKRRRSKKEGDEDDEDDNMPAPLFPQEFDMKQHSSSFSGATIVPPNVVRPEDMHMRAPPNGQYDTGFVPPGAPDNMNYPMLSQRSDKVTPDGSGGGGGSGGGVQSSISPVDQTFGTVSHSGGPASATSPSVLSAAASTPYQPSQQGIFGLLNGSKPTPPPNSAAAVPSYASDSLGSADPRLNLVKRGIISNSDAMDLVGYFHSRLAPWLFGYRLEFGKFPYIPQGPSVITPFILSVMCLVASERVPSKHKHQRVLGTEVNQLLINSPADSFISTLESPFGGGSGIKDEDGEEELDPELGIGPEEIVGACILATFMTDRANAATIASSAFKWARGWIKWTSLTVPLPPTLGEVCGLLPVKRDATREDMARVWLLCYIVDGTEALQRDNPAPPRRDPMAYCHVLVPDSPLPGDSYSPNDILLTFHARLITLLRDWYHRRAAAEGTPATCARLASSVNASLEWWRADLESHQLDDEAMRFINLFWEFARMLVNATSAKNLAGNPRLSAASWAIGVEAAVGFLEKCSKWHNKDDLANLPPCYLSMINLAGNVLVDAISDQGAESPFRPDEAVPLLHTVAEMLQSGGLPANHAARQSGQQLRELAQRLGTFA